MKITEVKRLLSHHSFTKALVIDDGFDALPDFGELIPDVADSAADLVDGLPPELKARLSSVLADEALDGDDWESGLQNVRFLAELWTMRSEKVLSDAVNRAVFGDYDAKVDQKRRDLEPLIGFLSTELNLDVVSAGRESVSLPPNTKLVFLDLFLGLNDIDSARKEAIDRIKLLLNEVADAQRPVVVLMSTKTGEELEHWAEELRERAGLMGAKFRVVSKREFEREGALATVMEELLAPLDDANTVAELIDTWNGALDAVRERISADLRRLDVADYGYLKRYRLDAENMPLGAYLMEAYGDVLRYELEGCTELLDASEKVDGLAFDAPPFPHFLPHCGVNFLSHAMNFVNEKTIDRLGAQMQSAAGKVRLGDLVVRCSDADALCAGRILSIPVHVVISQVCDLQQGKSDSVLLLSGTMSPRDWDDAFKVVDSRIDCFLWKDKEYSIDLEKSNLNAWGKELINRRLRVGGDFKRIGRLRDLPALKAQQLFSANLTRVGTLAAPHAVLPVGLTVEFKDASGKRQTLFTTSADEQMACLLKGLVRDGKKSAGADYLVFNNAFAKRLGHELGASATKFNPSVLSDVEEFSHSDIALSRLRQPCQMNKQVSHNRLKIDIRKGTVEEPKHHITIIANVPRVVAELLAAN